ncbi:hypothetical protein LTR66_017391 [Elasticomyces elasticus]|nr:hypothetical protein LTR66_017391 [Elasticomyces elasticus]
MHMYLVTRHGEIFRRVLRKLNQDRIVPNIHISSELVTKTVRMLLSFEEKHEGARDPTTQKVKEIASPRAEIVYSPERVLLTQKDKEIIQLKVALAERDIELVRLQVELKHRSDCESELEEKVTEQFNVASSLAGTISVLRRLQKEMYERRYCLPAMVLKSSGSKRLAADKNNSTKKEICDRVWRNEQDDKGSPKHNDYSPQSLDMREMYKIPATADYTSDYTSASQVRSPRTSNSIRPPFLS